MTAHSLSRRDARRIAVRAQCLTADRPTDLVQMIRHLTLLQLDPTDAIAPSAHLVAWSRLGSAYSRVDLLEALRLRSVVELFATIRPAEDVALYRAEMLARRVQPAVAEWQQRQRSWIEANDACRRDILARLASQGPLPSRELPDTCAVPWKSTGWTNDHNVIRLLDQLSVRGEVAVAGRQGRDRLWDLAERVYPDDPAVPVDEAIDERNQRRLRALGIARARTTKVPIEPYDVGSAGEPAVIEGIKGEWRVDPEQLGRPLHGRTALLSPFDRLIHDRRRAREIFGFDFGIEMYKAADQRRWGYYALPILHEDRLVGKLDAAADRRTGVLRVRTIHQDEDFTPAMSAAVDAEIAALAEWLGLELEPEPPSP